MTPALALVWLVWAVGIVLMWLWCRWPLAWYEIPGAVLAWLAGGRQRRRLMAIIARRNEEERQRAQAEEKNFQDLARKYRVRPATVQYIVLSADWDITPLHSGLMSRDELRAAVPCPEPTRLAVPGEPACDDPGCTGCQALLARKAHEAAW